MTTRSLGIGLILVCAACGGNPSPGGAAAPASSPAAATAAPATTAARVTGTFAFEERSQSETLLAGTFTVTDDSVTIEATPGPCRYEQAAATGRSIVYRCGELMVSFDRQRPSERATFVYDRRVSRAVRVCRLEGTDAAGRRICLREENEEQVTMVPTTVRIRGRKMP